MPSWQALTDEALRWHDAGRAADLWWRDDDATDCGPTLERLLALHRETAVPLALAVVPALATQALADRMTEEPGVDVLQHGYAHVNHASPAEKKMELGPHRPAMVVVGELGTGWLAMERLFPARALPILVPPWNRISPALVPTLPEVGFRGLSTFGPRRARPLRGLLEINTHVDLLDWKGRRGFVGEVAALGALVAALGHARTVSHEAVGILSHHLAMDAKAWDFLSSMCEKATTMPGLRLRPVRELLGAAAAATREGCG
ncbi:MAG TPA: polysaccharide deacetylase family protein [Reyranella sp.]|nr:polysaccharide deacetylase family protein [Reyranella sp.]